MYCVVGFNIEKSTEFFSNVYDYVVGTKISLVSRNNLS